MINKYKKGFSLVELLLVVGVIAVVAVSLYSYYSKKASEALVKSEVIGIQILQNGIDRAYIANNDFSNLTQANVIAWNLATQEMSGDGVNLKSGIGDNITFNQVVIAGQPGYEIQINRVPTAECIRFMSTKYADQINGLRVNAVQVKVDNTNLTGANIATATGACAAGGQNNTIGIRVLPYRIPNVVIPPVVARLKEDPYFVPTIGNSVAAPGGLCSTATTLAVWNGSFCACPTGTKWNGTLCQTFGAVAGWCQYGQGSVNGGACANLLPTPATTRIYTTTTPASQAACDADPNGYRNPGGYWTGTTCLGIRPPIVKGAGSVASPIPVITSAAAQNNPNNDVNDAARNLPFAPAQPVKIVTAQAAQCQGVGGFWDGRTCNVCPNPTQVRSASGAFIPLLPAPNPAKQSTSNGFRCVTAP